MTIEDPSGFRKLSAGEATSGEADSGASLRTVGSPARARLLGLQGAGVPAAPVEMAVEAAVDADEMHGDDANPLLHSLGSLVAPPEPPAPEAIKMSAMPTAVFGVPRSMFLTAIRPLDNPILAQPEVARALAIGSLVAGCAVGAFTLGFGGALITMAVEALAFAGGVLMSRAGQKRLEEVAEKLRFEASHDGLTGLLNRKSIMEALEAAIEQGSRQGQAVAVLMADIDYFKRINDTFGHQAGDEVLRMVARRVADCLREGDRVGRYGGEEFLVLMPDATTEVAAAAGERIRATVGRDPVTTPFGTISVTSSVGVAASDRAGYLPQMLLRAADEALYRAKHGGRNRVEVAMGPVSG